MADREARPKARRSWRKLYLGVDAATGQIAACILTGNDADYAGQVQDLLATLAIAPRSARRWTSYPLSSLGTGIREGDEVRCVQGWARGAVRSRDDDHGLCRCRWRHTMVGVEWGLPLQQDAGDREQPVGDAAEGTAVGVAALP